MAQFTQRTLVPELMDDPDADPQDLARSLAFIRFINARLGGASAAIAHLRRWFEQRPPSSDEPARILDVGTGSADIPIAIVKWASKRNLAVHITCIDMHETTLELARQHLAAQPQNLPITLEQADALLLTDRYPAGSFDYAHAGMFLHHLQDIDALTMLRIMDRLTTHGLIWNDLVRSAASRLGVKCLVRLFPGLPRMARHDAVVSIDAGFTKAESLDFAQRAGLTNVRYQRHVVYRFSLTSEKHPR